MNRTAALLLDTARRNELHHAVILHGPAPEMLRDLAVRIAKTLNCFDGSNGDDCAACTKIDRGIHPDVHFIGVGGDRKQISIEQIREIVSGASLRPFEGRNKVFVVEGAESLSIAGSNSLLKTLEEPARDTTFLLLTRSPDLLLPTIRSRSHSIFVGETERPTGGSLQSVRLRQVTMSAASEDLAASTLELLHRYASRGEGAALLALAAVLASHDDPRDALATLGAVLCDLVALDPEQTLDAAKVAEIRERIPRERLLAAADASLAAIRSLTVNADVRLVAEQAVAALVS